MELQNLVVIKNKEIDKIEHLSNSIEYTKNLPEPRVIKTHLPWKFLPEQIKTGKKKPKIIYVARNPKDVCVSYYKHCTLVPSNDYTFEEFANAFLADRGKIHFY